MKDKPKDDIDLEQRIYHLERENNLLKLQIEHDKIEVEAAKKFLQYIMTDFTHNIPDVFNMHSERHWAIMGKQ